MNILDWIVLLVTLLSIVLYGTIKTRGSKNIEGYLMGGHHMKWYTIGLSVMATQASAITFLSTPGQAFEEGMGFVQFYFGLPIAIVIICVVFLPVYYRLNVYTAYEYLENRFDLKTRMFTALLFLTSRGLAAGITIYAPAIILSSILGWPLNLTNLFIGVLVIVYTVSGGTAAVSKTQKQQMFIIFVGMFFAFGTLLYLLPPNISFTDALHVAGATGKLDVVDFSIDPETRYTFWSGITGGLFLSLSYFGTDQSQVQRYLSGKSLAEGRYGLLFNGLLKIPMQFFILLTGVLVFVFYQFVQPPLFFNETALAPVKAKTEYAEQYRDLEKEYELNFDEKQNILRNFGEAGRLEEQKEALKEINTKDSEIRQEAKELINTANPGAETEDADYVFITFVMNYLPHGMIGLLLAVIFSAAMSSTAGELNALASTSIVDFYKRVYKKDGSDRHYVIVSKLFTAFWGVLAILFAVFASLVENLIEAVNIIGSLFYGTILGVFLTAFFLKKVRGTPMFIAMVISEIVVVTFFIFSDISFLWFNALGCVMVVGLSLLINTFIPGKNKA